MQTVLGGSGGMLPRENFRKFGVPWTAFYAFRWWTKREIKYRVVKRRSKSINAGEQNIYQTFQHFRVKTPIRVIRIEVSICFYVLFKTWPGNMTATYEV